MKKLLAIFFLLLSFVYGAKVGDVISNVATVSYSIADLNKSIQTNRVDLTISKTPATIEYLRFDSDGNNSLNLEPTKYKEGNITKSMDKPKLAGGKSLDVPNRYNFTKTDSYLTNDLAIIKVTDLDQNIDASKQDEITITITNSRSGEVEILILKETESNSGVFVGYIQIVNSSEESYNGSFGVKNGDVILSKYQDSNQAREIAVEAVVANANALFVTKTSSKQVASAGDFVQYTLSVTNNTNATEQNVTIKDLMPIGMKYKRGSFRVDSLKMIPNYDGKELSINIDKIEPNGTVNVSYIAEITPNIDSDTLVNRAFAFSEFGGKSNTARATVKLRDDFFKDKGYILGEVYSLNSSGKREPVSSVKIYLEDGRYAVSDKEGKYHFLNLDNGTHIVQLDTYTIKGRYKLSSCGKDNRFAKSKKSAFVDIVNGEMHRVDFCLKKIYSNFKDAKVEADLVKVNENRLKLTFNLFANSTLYNKEMYIKLPTGFEYDATSFSGEGQLVFKNRILVLPFGDKNSVSIDLEVKKGAVDDEIDSILYYDSNSEQDLESPKLSLGLKSIEGKLHIVDSRVSVKLGTVLKESTQTNYSWKKPTKHESMPQEYSKEQIDAIKQEAEFVWPPKGWIPNIPSTRVAILVPNGGSVELKLNGQKVDMVHYQGVFRGSKKRIIHFKGIDLFNGNNHFEAIVKKGKKVIATLTRDIFVESHAPASAEVVTKYSYLKADGVHSPIIAVRFRGKSGHLLRGGLVGSYEVNKPFEPLVKSNDKGQYKIDSKGIAYIKLKPTYNGGKVRLKFGKLSVNTEIETGRKGWIVVGFAEGTVGYRTLSKHSLKGAKGFYKDGQLSLFAQGKIKGKWLLTLSYNSKKRGRELFDRIDPNRYYTLYQDNSKNGSTAQSRKRLYLKLEKEDFYALFGDFKTDFSDNRLSVYNHAYTGFKSEYRHKNFLIKSFIAKSDKANIREQIAGNGTKGYYYLKHKDIVAGSEEISIETRDKDRDYIVVDSKTLKANIDYTIDYDLGRIYFKEPVYSHNTQMQPMYIVAKYQINGGSRYIYGARATWESNRTKIGATYVKEQGEYELIGADAKVKIGKHLSAKVEIAKTTRGDLNKTSSTAELAELEYKDKNTTAKAYYKSVKSGFVSSDIDKSTTKDYGIKIDKKFDKKHSASILAHHQTSNSSSKSEVEAKLNYSDKNLTASAGYKWSKTSGESAKNQLTLDISKKINKKLSVALSHTQTFDFKDMKSSIGATYKKDKNSTISGYVERVKDEQGSRYQVRTQMEYKPWKNSSFKTSRLYKTSDDSTYIYDTYELKQSFNFNKHTKATLGVEVDVAKDSYEKSYTAINGSIKYSDKNITSHLDVGYKFGDDEKNLNVDSGIYLQKHRDYAMSFGINWHQNWQDSKVIREVNGKFAFVYRPMHGKLIVLDRFDLKDKLDKDGTSSLRETKFVNNLHLNYQDSNTSRYSLQFGLKYAIDTIESQQYSSFNALLGVRGEWDVQDSLTLGVRASTLYSFSANSSEYSLGIFAVKTINENMQIIAGYNFKGFRDEDYSVLNNHRQGVYLKLRIKFDQDGLKPLLDEVSK